MSLIHLISPLLGVPAINTLLQSIVNQYLFNSYCLTVVSEAPVDLSFNLGFTYITPNYSVEILADQLLHVSEQGCSDYIVKMRDPAIFMAAFDLVSKTGNIRRGDKKIIVLANPADLELNNTNDSSLGLFSMREIEFVANIMMILPTKVVSNDCEVYNIVTSNFGRILDGKTKEPLFLDQWSSCAGFKTNANLFPNDLKNLHGKLVRVASFTYKPYVLLDLDPVLEPKMRDGIEIRIIEEFCIWLNCTIDILREDKDQWGEILSNGTGVGVLGSVAGDHTDFGIAGLYPWYEVFLYLDFSAAIIRSGVTCVAPAPRLLASWELPLMPFTWYMWYAVLITFLFATIGLVIAKRCSTDEVILTVFRAIIAQSQKNVELNWRVRSIMGWLLVAGLILVSAYGGGLASTFTVPKFEASIDTVKDLVDRKLEWGATHDAWIFSLTMSNEPLIKQLVSQFRIYPAQELKKRSFMRNMGFSVEKLPAGNFAIGDYLMKDALLDMRLMLEDFYYEQCVIMTRKSSPYTEKLSALVGRLHQSGLLLAWETQVALKYLNFEVQQEVKLSRFKNDRNFIKPLDLEHLVGIFILYVIGTSLSIVLFLAELYSSRLYRRIWKCDIVP